jgi:hypothetical protein
MPLYPPELSLLLPPKKVACCPQIENKLRIAVIYELASNIPLIQ